MRKVKLKLKYTELQVMDHLLTEKVHELDLSNYANKAVLALLVEYGLKQLKPHTYMRYDKPKAITMPMAVACAIIHFYQSVTIHDMYTQNVLRTIAMHIDQKILPS